MRETRVSSDITFCYYRNYKKDIASSRNQYTSFHHITSAPWSIEFEKKHPRQPVDKSSKINPRGKERCRGMGEPKPSHPIWAKAPKIEDKR